VNGSPRAVDAIENLQELGWIPFGAHVLWHSDTLLSEDGTWGDLAHSFFGYADSPTVLQLVSYVAYLTIVLIAFLGAPRKITNHDHRARPTTAHT
jgi:high-affinity iron transporter